MKLDGIWVLGTVQIDFHMFYSNVFVSSNALVCKYNEMSNANMCPEIHALFKWI